MIRRRAVAVGRVQGVGFRYFCLEAAEKRGLRGWVRNRPDGAVELEAEGPDDAVAEFLQAVRRAFPGARVDRLDVSDVPATGEEGFDIRH
jgi:acylphosphatase